MSQGSWQVPTSGSESATTYAGQCNTAWLALASKNSGASAPANGPGSAPVQFQDWINNASATFPVWSIFDGVNWNRVGTQDVSGSNFLPKLGGGLGTVASAATTNIGAQPQTFVTVTGTTTIASFGSSATNGEMKVLYFAGQLQITNSASILCPGGINLFTQAGDMCFAVYDGAGAWLILNYQRAAAQPGTGLPAGALFWMYGSGVVPGTARANGNSIGNTGSGGTEGTGPAYLHLYQQIWNWSLGDPETVIFGGGRGASAIADWNALKAISLPDLRGRAPYGDDQMGAAAPAGRITSATATPNGTTTGAIFGAQQITLSTAMLPAYTPAGTVAVTLHDPGHTHAMGDSAAAVTQNNAAFNDTFNGGGATYRFHFQNSPAVASNTTGITVLSQTFTGTAQGGSSSAVTTISPGKIGTWYFVL